MEANNNNNNNNIDKRKKTVCRRRINNDRSKSSVCVTNSGNDCKIISDHTSMDGYNYDNESEDEDKNDCVVSSPPSSTIIIEGDIIDTTSASPDTSSAAESLMEYLEYHVENDDAECTLSIPPSYTHTTIKRKNDYDEEEGKSRWIWDTDTEEVDEGDTTEGEEEKDCSPIRIIEPQPDNDNNVVQDKDVVDRPISISQATQLRITLETKSAEESRLRTTLAQMKLSHRKRHVALEEKWNQKLKTLQSEHQKQILSHETFLLQIQKDVDELDTNTIKDLKARISQLKAQQDTKCQLAKNKYHKQIVVDIEKWKKMELVHWKQLFTLQQGNSHHHSKKNSSSLPGVSPNNPLLGDGEVDKLFQNKNEQSVKLQVNQTIESEISNLLKSQKAEIEQLEKDIDSDTHTWKNEMTIQILEINLRADILRMQQEFTQKEDQIRQKNYQELRDLSKQHVEDLNQVRDTWRKRSRSRADVNETNNNDEENDDVFQQQELHVQQIQTLHKNNEIQFQNAIHLHNQQMKHLQETQVHLLKQKQHSFIENQFQPWQHQRQQQLINDYKEKAQCQKVQIHDKFSQDSVKIKQKLQAELDETKQLSRIQKLETPLSKLEQYQTTQLAEMRQFGRDLQDQIKKETDNLNKFEKTVERLQNEIQIAQKEYEERMKELEQREFEVEQNRKNHEEKELLQHQCFEDDNNSIDLDDVALNTLTEEEKEVHLLQYNIQRLQKQINSEQSASITLSTKLETIQNKTQSLTQNNQTKLSQVKLSHKELINEFVNTKIPKLLNKKSSIIQKTQDELRELKQKESDLTKAVDEMRRQTVISID